MQISWAKCTIRSRDLSSKTPSDLVLRSKSLGIPLPVFFPILNISFKSFIVRTFEGVSFLSKNSSSPAIAYDDGEVIDRRDLLAGVVFKQLQEHPEQFPHFVHPCL